MDAFYMTANYSKNTSTGIICINISKGMRLYLGFYFKISTCFDSLTSHLQAEKS
jgi:hypothetical protein